MESSSTLLTSLNQRKSSPTRKPPQKQKRKMTTTNKPIKVRYISNPMRVETCASKFRELVQELTGQDAVDLPPEHKAFAASADLHQEEMNHAPLDEGIPEYYSPLDHEDVFNNAPQMSAGVSGFFSSGFYNVNALGSIGSL
ncbi:sigma factor binding protein 2, chloroplastic [Eutrema salsugineum]|nr:sigma factor binding protein 2, chloroplastic [Eutrema salsugineum]